MASLEEQSSNFAAEIQEIVDAAFPRRRTITSTRVPESTRFVFQPVDGPGEPIPVALPVDDERLADLAISFYQDLDRSGVRLKTVRSQMVVRSILERPDLFRCDYRNEMRSVPIAHWQVYAERGR